MRKQYLDLTCVLRLDREMTPPTWSSWCPELDLVSMGGTADEAVTMLAQAIQMVVEDDLSHGRWETSGFEDPTSGLEDPIWVPKRVQHPFRRGATAKDSDDYPVLEDKRAERGVWEFIAYVPLRDLEDGLDDVAVVFGCSSWQVRSGILGVDFPEFSWHACVPGTRFQVHHEVTYPSSSPLDIRSSTSQTLSREALRELAAATLNYDESANVNIVRIEGPMPRRSPTG